MAQEWHTDTLTQPTMRQANPEAPQIPYARLYKALSGLNSCGDELASMWV